LRTGKRRSTVTNVGQTKKKWDWAETKNLDRLEQGRRAGLREDYGS
jgi:hypothetical protein